MIDTIYIEEAVLEYPRTQKILRRFDKARLISIDRYGEVFNKRAQNFRLQKIKPSLILAKKHAGHVLPTPEGFGIGNTLNFYFAHMLNCVFDCRYCFLQGMYASSNYVVFVNFEDFDTAITRLIAKHYRQKLTFFSGYDCDSLALDGVTGFTEHILPVFRNRDSATIEFRTKSVQIRPLLEASIIDNCVIAFSLMPDAMARALDHGAPPIHARLKAMNKLAAEGWKVGPRFDPLIYGKNWKNHYQELFEQVFSLIPKDAIHSVSFGPLRFPQSMFRNIVKLYPEEKLFSQVLPVRNGVIAYEKDIEEEMTDFCLASIKKFVSDGIIFRCAPEVQAIH